MLATVHLMIWLPVCCLKTKRLKFTVVLYVGETFSVMLIEEPRETDGVWEQHLNMRGRKWQEAGKKVA